MGYYLEKATDNKNQLTALNFDPHQLNFMLKMMLQCRQLRQNKVIVNLLEQSLPEGNMITEKTNETKDGKAYSTWEVDKV